MKTFKKAVLLVFMVVCLCSFSITAFATEEEPVSAMADETIPDFDGLDATPRDCTALNIREEPSASSKILATIPLGEHFKVLDQTGEWFQMKYQNFSGYVHWKYFSFVEPEIVENSNLIGNSIIHYKSSENRDMNMAIACSTINGLVLNSGDEFRWSEIIGKTTAEKGYLEAPVIINKVSVPGLGGGVCQVSTTIYNALFDTSIVPLEVHEHSIGCAYAKRDATVAHGVKDFVFENTYDFPIQIQTYCYKSIVFVDIYRVETTQ